MWLKLDNLLSQLPRRDRLAGAFCIGVILLAVLVRYLFPISGPFLSFYPAVLFCALVGGHRLGLLALAAGLVIAPFFFAPEALPPTPLWNLFSWASFGIFGFVIVTAIDFQQRTLEKSRQLAESLQRQQHFGDVVVTAAPSLTYIYDLETARNVFISPQCANLLGYLPEEIAAMGSALSANLVHAEDMPRIAARFEAMMTAPGSEPPDIEYRMRRKDGSIVWLLSSDRVFARADDGRPRQILGVATDISARKRFEEQLLASEERFRGVFENAPTGISLSDLEGRFVQCNPAFAQMLGYGMAELQNRSFLETVHPDDRAADRAALQRLLRGETASFETFNRALHKSGRIVWVHNCVALLKGRQGEPASIVRIVTDVTERKRQEEQIRLLMREVNHRSKNLLAVVQSVARQTAAHGDPSLFAARFSERLQGLSASHDLLVHNAWQGVALADLVSSQLSPYADLVGTRISVEGPALRINPSAAQSIGMALHELAVNAAKYGALSRDVGSVQVTWELAGEGPAALFRMRWREQGGPPVAAPVSSGLGTLILTRLLQQSLDAEAVLDYAPTGLSWALSAPLAKVIEEQRPVAL